MTVAKVDIGGVCVEAPASNPPQPPKAMVSPYADTMLYGILSPAHPKPECQSSIPWDDATTKFQDACREYAIKLQTAIQAADMNEFAYRAVRRDNDALQPNTGPWFAWNRAPEIPRTSPAMNAMAQAFGLTAHQVNAIFIAASQLEG